MVEKTKEKKFSVKTFQYMVRKEDQNIATREIAILGKDLSWDKAKELRKQNKYSWIDVWYPESKKKEKKNG